MSPGRMSVSRLLKCWLHDLSFFGTFILGNENAGGSAICIHKDLLPEDAIVTHMITYCERTVWSETSSDR